MSISAPYPIFLDLAQKPVLIVGGGAVALRKARGLAAALACVTVVSPEFAEGFAEMPHVIRIKETYTIAHISHRPWRLVFTATNDRSVNNLVQEHASVRGILCCRCDEPDLGDFSGGAVWRSEHGHVTVAVATAGASPVLATRLRNAAAGAIDPVLIVWAELMGSWRGRAKQEIRDPGLRRELHTRMAGQIMETCLRNQGTAAATALFDEWLRELRAAPGISGASAARTSEHAE